MYLIQYWTLEINISWSFMRKFQLSKLDTILVIIPTFWKKFHKLPSRHLSLTNEHN